MSDREKELNGKDERTLAEKLKASREAAARVLAVRKAALARKQKEEANQEENQSSVPCEDKSP
jgi:uncharacterized membrane protein